MEDWFQWLWFLLVSYVGLVFVVKVVFHLWWIPRKIENHFRKQGIKGPKYQLFLGNLKELASLNLKASAQPMLLSHNILPRVLSFYHHWKKIYGATFLVWFGPTPRLTVSDPAVVREIFILKSDYFEKNESPLLVRKLEGDGLLSLKGEKWAHHRKIIQPTFYTENLKLMMPMMAKSVEEAVERWSDEMSNAGKVEVEVSEWFQNLVEDAITRTTFGSSYKDGRAIFDLQSQQMVHATEAFQKVFIPGYRYLMMPMMAKSVEEAVERWSDEMSNAGKVEVEVSEWFQNLVEDAITRTTFGSSYKDGRAIFDLQSQQMVHATEAFQKVFIPGYRFLPTKKNRISWRLDKEIRKSLMKLIEERRKNSTSQTLSEECPNDLLELMIKACLKQTQINSSNISPSSSTLAITVQDIVEECKTIFFAGKHTTSNLLTWTTILLAMHPQWQEQAREEVLRVSGARDSPTKDDLAKLKTLGMILNESLRLYPPAVAIIRRLLLGLLLVFFVHHSRNSSMCELGLLS
ncbi:unnamed protein product [Fraxinus pennsylvanica]|uniref:Cytochrome P450 n=1 Tax=Fraxinus pennsylvanica TaxID=56036 RepID=A0AAD2EDV2_9LAMI|nr:unnamed protein product [Fraxinus pennsylvanica]